MYEDRQSCLYAIGIASKARNSLEYLDIVFGIVEQDLFKAFKDAPLQQDSDILTLVPLKYRYDALFSVKMIIESHINQGKIAEKMLAKLDK